jgi:uncharacterized protein YndB with AHSA1/START domain
MQAISVRLDVVTTLTNTITIEASADRVWTILTNLGELEKYDPTVAASTVTSTQLTGPGATRKVTMTDGKHWFNERVTTFEPASVLTFQLTACNLNLSHSYSLAEDAERTTVTQVMTYTPRFGLAGKLLDAIAIRRNSDAGVKKFFNGLKAHAERT